MARKRPTVVITMDPEILAWIERMIKDKKFPSKSAAIQWCVAQVRENELAKRRLDK